MKGFFFIGVISIILGVLFYKDDTLVANFLQSARNGKGTLSSHDLLVSNVIKGLEAVAVLEKVTNCSRVAVGYNANLDLIVKALDVLKALESELPPNSLGDHEKLTSLTDFNEAIGYYFDKGSAAERFVEDRKVFEQIVTASKNLPERAKHWHIGGNAALMANRFAKEGCQQILLGGIVGKTLASLLHPSIKIAGQSNEDADQDDQNIDQVHLILEYEKGASWGRLRAPRANRFIAVRDEPNSKIAALESFHDSLADFNPQLVIISGLHLLEGQESSYRESRLKTVVSHLQPPSSNLPLSIPVHLELASVGDPSYMKQLVLSVLPNVNSLGLNEQELGSVYFSLGGKQETSESFKDPKVRTIVDTIKYIFDNLAKNEKRSLTRIHFHCLTFHLIAERKQSGWQNARRSVATASMAATKQACDMETIQATEVELLVPLTIEKGRNNGKELAIDPSNPVLSWEESSYEFHLSPVLVCKVPKKTVGLGDAISTVGLLHQSYSLPKEHS